MNNPSFEEECDFRAKKETKIRFKKEDKKFDIGKIYYQNANSTSIQEKDIQKRSGAFPSNDFDTALKRCDNLPQHHENRKNRITFSKNHENLQKISENYENKHPYFTISPNIQGIDESKNTSNFSEISNPTSEYSSSNFPKRSKGKCKYNLHKWLTKLFFNLGNLIALRPSYFIIVPAFITILGSTGFQKIYIEKDQETLFYPTTGVAPKERAIVEKYFPQNTSTNFLPYQITRPYGHTRLLIEAKDKGTILRKEHWKEMLHLDKMVRNFTISYGDDKYGYTNVCAIWNRNCWRNVVLDLYEDIEIIENGTLKITYPFMLFPLILPMYFGGIELDEQGDYIKSAKAISLSYFIRHDTDEEKERDRLWENKFIDLVGKMDYKFIHVSRYGGRSFEALTRENTDAVVPYIPSIIVLVVLFSMVNNWTQDTVRSKVYLGLFGIISTMMGTVTAFGLLMYVGVSNSGINIIIPFIMLGIGLDDVFVFMAAWRRTSIQDEVSSRLASTYGDAGVSITITSLTNMISFAAGAIGPIQAVRFFCIYTSFSLLFTYLWHLSLFGGCLAFAGYLEKSQRHSLWCSRVKARSQAEKDGDYCYAVWCSGGINKNDPWNRIDNKHHVVMLFFKKYFGRALTNKCVKATIIMMFLVYLIGAIYGCFSIKEGLDRKLTVRYDAYIVDYFEMEDRLFRQHPYQIQVVITGDLKYSDPITRRKIIALHHKFERLPFISKFLSKSWMKDWFRKLKRLPKLRSQITSEKDFIRKLKKRQLYGAGNLQAVDVAFNKNFTRIIASRFILQTTEVPNTNADKNILMELRKIASESELKVTVFNPNFLHFDQYAMVKGVVIECIAVGAVSVILISLVFIPTRWCSLLVGFSIISIEVGVLGYMALWNVNLDPVSMIALIMCIGFSVDFSVHISYSYLTSTAKTPDEKIVECLYCLGLPIVQGALSTIISIVTFIFVPAYAYVAFFKVILLVVTFSIMHGLFIIPVLLSLTGSNIFKNCFNSQPKFVENDSPRNSGGKDSNTDLKQFFRGLKVGPFGSYVCEQTRHDPEGCSNEEFSIESSNSDTIERSSNSFKSSLNSWKSDSNSLQSSKNSLQKNSKGDSNNITCSIHNIKSTSNSTVEEDCREDVEVIDTKM